MRLIGPFESAGLLSVLPGIAALAVMTRGLHLDGLADTADGLGPLRSGERSLQVMHQSDIGPFGVVTLVLTLLLQVACLAALLPTEAGWLALWTAVVVARLAMARTGLPGVSVADGSSLGSLVAGTVSAAWFAGGTLHSVKEGMDGLLASRRALRRGARGELMTIYAANGRLESVPQNGLSRDS